MDDILMSSDQAVVTPNYPPIPYPALNLIAPIEPLSTSSARRSRAEFEDDDDMQFSTSTTRGSGLNSFKTPTKKVKTKTFLPFKPVTLTTPKSSSSPYASVSTSKDISSPVSIPSTPLSIKQNQSALPIESTTASSSPLVKKGKVFSPFRPPSFNSSSFNSNRESLPNQLLRLEKRVLVLRQAVKYSGLLSDEMNEDDDGLDEQTELEILCKKWLFAGRAAASHLWTHLSNENSNSSFDFGGTSNGWSSTYGFDSGTKEVNPFLNNPSNSWGYGGNSLDSSESMKDFKQSLAVYGQESGKNEAEVLEELSEEERTFPIKRYCREKVVHSSKNRTGSIQVGEVSEGTSMEVDVSKDEEMEVEEEKEAENEWNMGKMMKMAGVDPDLFGWKDDEEEDWE